jgi:hypothetical protein
MAVASSPATNDVATMLTTYFCDIPVIPWLIQINL